MTETTDEQRRITAMNYTVSLSQNVPLEVGDIMGVVRNFYQFLDGKDVIDTESGYDGPTVVAFAPEIPEGRSGPVKPRVSDWPEDQEPDDE